MSAAKQLLSLKCPFQNAISIVLVSENTLSLPEALPEVFRRMEFNKKQRDRCEFQYNRLITNHPRNINTNNNNIRQEMSNDTMWVISKRVWKEQEQEQEQEHAISCSDFNNNRNCFMRGMIDSILVIPKMSWKQQQERKQQLQRTISQL
jgi:hypothetical protein